MFQLSPEIIDKLDKLSPPPSVIAGNVYEVLKEHKELTQYDLYCFAIEMLGAGVVCGELKYIEGSIKLSIKDFYYAHYLRLYECLTSEAGSTLTQDNNIKVGPSLDSKTRLRLL